MFAIVATVNNKRFFVEIDKFYNYELVDDAVEATMFETKEDAQKSATKFVKMVEANSREEFNLPEGEISLTVCEFVAKHHNDFQAII